MTRVLGVHQGRKVDLRLLCLLVVLLYLHHQQQRTKAQLPHMILQNLYTSTLRTSNQLMMYTLISLKIYKPIGLVRDVIG